VRIHLFCDHKWRDLPPLSAVKLYLEAMGHRVTMASVKDSLGLLPLLRPDCVVLNHFWGSFYNDLGRRLKAAGVAIVVLPTEGAGRPVFHEMDRGDVTDFSLVDRLLSWSERNTQAMLQRGAVGPDQIVSTGCPRLDFYRRPLNAAVMSRKAFCALYEFDPARPIITWATQFPHAHVERANTRVWTQYEREMTDFGVSICLQAIGVDFAELPQYHRELRNVSADAFFAMVAEHPEWQFLLKPHPVEQVSFYEERIARAAATNVRFCKEEYIWDVLNATDVLLHRHCTTGVEAWLLDKPTIEMAMIPDGFMAWPEREAGSITVTSFAELDAAVGACLVSRVIEPERRAKREAYVREWFGEPDGRRCLDIAGEIHRLVMERGPRHGDFGPVAKIAGGWRNILATAFRYLLAIPATQSVRAHLSGVMSGAVQDAPTGKLITQADVRRFVEILCQPTQAALVVAPPNKPLQGDLEC
jgi:surface carbohydrate biosynthesis protein